MHKVWNRTQSTLMATLAATLRLNPIAACRRLLRSVPMLPAMALVAIAASTVLVPSAFAATDTITITTATTTCSPTGLTDGSGTICAGNTTAFSLTALEAGTQSLSSVVGTQTSPVYLVVNDTTSSNLTLTYSGAAEAGASLKCNVGGTFSSALCSITGVQGAVTTGAAYGPPAAGWPSTLVAQFGYTGVAVNAQFDIAFSSASTSDLATLTSPCYGTCQQNPSCPAGSSTVITGTVYVPNGVDPLPNALVYIPSATPDPLVVGVQCLVAGTEGTGSPVSQTHTAVDGTFTLNTGVPSGTNIPIVIESGKWRMQGSVQTVTSCVSNTAPAWATTFPSTHMQGDIPKMALVTGNVDSLECVLRKTGIADSEFTNPGGTGPVQFYKGSGSGGAVINGSTPSETTLVSSTSTLGDYDMVMFPCQGGEYTQTSTDLANVLAYGNEGGRIFATHYSYVWLYDNPTSSTGFGAAATWKINQGDPTPDPGVATVDTSFANGSTLSQWLQNAGASTTLTQIDISTLRLDQTGVIAPTQSWLTLNTNNTSGEIANPVMQMTFNTPVNAAASAQCGRVLFNEYHVENASGTDGDTFPSECSNTAMTPQEKLLEYALFDLSNAITPVVAPMVTQNYVNTPTVFTQGDTGDTITDNVVNTSATVPLDASAVLTITLPPGETATALTDPTGGWICTVATLTCTRTTPLAPGATDSVVVTTNVSPTAPLGTGGSLGSTISGGYLSSNVVGTDPLDVVGGSPQAITFNPATPVTYGTAPITLTGTGGCSGNPVTYSIVSGPGTLSGPNNDILTVTGVGPIVIAANQAAGNGCTAAPTVDGTINVNPAVLTVTANPGTKTYGSANPALSVASITGYVNGDTSSVVSGAAALSTTAVTSSPVGSYPITPSQGTLSAANYTFVYVSAPLTVTPAVLTVNANNANKAYNTANPTLTDSITGFVNGDTSSVVSGAAALSTTASTPSPVGTYPITAAQGTLSATNYSFVYVPATLTVTPAPQDIVFTPPTSPMSAGAGPITLTAAGGGSGNPVTFSIVSGPGTLSGPNNDILTVTGTGAVVIAANQAGNGNYYAAPTVDQTVLVAAMCDVPTSEPVGTTSPVQTAVIPITTNFTLGNISVGVVGAPGLDYALVSGGTCSVGTAYTAGQTCTVNYTFTPTSSGTQLGNITLSDNTSVVEAGVGLNGTGTGPEVVFSPGVQTTVVSGSYWPEGVVVDGAGNLYNTAVGLSQLLKQTNSGGSYTQSSLLGSGALNGPYGLALGCNGNLYIANEDGNDIVKETWNGTGYTQTTIGYGMADPNGVAVDCSGNVYVADSGNSRILKETLQPNGNYVQTTIVDSADSIRGPQGVAVDGSGDVYILDTYSNRVLKEAPNGSGGYTETTVTTSGLNDPLGIAVDGNANVYITDTGNQRILRETLSGGVYTQSVIPTTGLGDAFGLTVDSMGNIYVADASNDRIVKIDVSTAPVLNFASTTVGVASWDSPQTVAVTNIGNTALTFPIPASGNDPSITTNFTLNSVGATACPLVSSSSSSAGSLVAGGICNLPVSFIPTVSGSLNGSLVLTDNNLNVTGATQTIALHGASTAATQTIAFASLPPVVTYGVSPLTLSATATSGLPVTFSVVSGPATVAGTTLTITGGGTVVVAANQAGNGGYEAAQVVTQTILVNHATTTTVIGASSNPVLVQNATTLTATVTGAYAVPTGSVNFVDDSSTLLGTGTLNGAGVATFTTSSLLVGTQQITAVYTGDTNYTGSTSIKDDVVVDDFSLTVPGGSSTTPSVTALPGGTATFTFTLSPVGSSTFLAPVTLTAVGLPAGATTNFSPVTILAGAGPTLVTLTVTLLPQTGELTQPFIGHPATGPTVARNTKAHGMALAPFALALLLLPFAGKVRKAGKRMRIFLPVLLLLAALGVATGISGCGTQNPAVYNVTVNATSGTLTHTTGFTLTLQ